MSDFSKMENQPASGRISLEAASWIAQLDEGRLSASDRLALTEWISRSPKHSQEIHTLANFWGVIDQLIDQAVLKEKNPGFSGLLTAWFSMRPKSFSAVLASIVVIVFTTSFIFSNPETWRSESGSIIVYDVKKGNNLIKTLSDGSTIHLNTDTVVEIQFTEALRTVRLLRGEVFFEVAKDTKRPFEVFVGDSHIVAVGTAFDVRLNNDKVNIMVTEGKIQFNQILPIDFTIIDQIAEEKLDTMPVLVNAGHQIKIDEVPKITKTDEIMIERQTAWRKGELVFVNSTLADIVSELSRYNTVDITMQPELRGLKIGGRFLTTDVNRVLEALEMSMDIDIQRHSDGTIFLAAR